MTLEREVIISTKIVPHSGNVAATKSMLDQLQSLQKSTVASMAHDATEAVRDVSSSVEKMAEKAADSIQSQVGSAANKAYITSRSVQEQMAGISAESKDMMEVNLAYTNAAAESFSRTLSGVMSLSRGFAILAYEGSDNLQKVLMTLMRIQAFFDVARGFVDVIISQVRNYQNLNITLKETVALKRASAAASTAEASASSVSRTATGSATESAIGGAIGAAATSGGLTGRVIGGLAKVVKVIGTALLALAGPLAIAAGIVAIFATAMAIFSKDFREGLFELIGLQDQEAESRKRMIERLNRRAEEEQKAKERIQIWSERRQAYYERTGATSGQILADANRFYDLGYNPRHEGQRGMYENRIQEARLRQQGLELWKKEQEERQRMEVEAYRQKVVYAQEELQYARQIYETRVQEYSEIQKQYKSGMARFGMANPYEQQLAITAMQKAERGERLNDKEVELLNKYAMSRGRSLAEAEGITRAKEAGYEKWFGPEERQAMKDLKDEARAAQKFLRRGINVHNDFNLRIYWDTDPAKMAEMFAARLKEQAEIYFEYVNKEIEKAVKREYAAEDAKRSIVKKESQLRQEVPK